MLVKVRAKAAAKNESIRKSGDIYEVSVRERAEGGMANARILFLLARHLGLPQKRLRIMKGARSPSKTIFVPDA